MDAFFVIPALVSPNINQRLVPALAKTIERNTILTNYGTIRLALLKKYANSTITREGIENFEISEDAILSEGLTEEMFTEGPNSSGPSFSGRGSWTKNDLDSKGKATGKSSSRDISLGPLTFPTANPDTGSKESDIFKKSANTSSKDAIEYPSGMTFYNTIGLEPTYLQIPIAMKKGFFSGGSSDRVLMVGFKCVPYQLKGTEDVVSLLKDMRGRSVIGKFFLKKWRTLATKIPLTIPHAIRKGGARGGETSKIWSRGGKSYDPVKDIIYSPTSDILANPNKLKKYMDVRKNSNWATLVILSNMDFEEEDMKQTLSTYKDMSESGMGDMVIVNEANESAYFCTTKMAACYNLPFAYMRNIMNMDNILDYAEVSRWNKPFSMVPIRKALNDGYIDNDRSHAQVIHEINSIIRSDTAGQDPHSVSLSNAMDKSDYSPTSQVIKDMAGDDPDSWTDPFDNMARRPTGTKANDGSKR